MKASEFIEKLKKFIKDNGDKELVIQHQPPNSYSPETIQLDEFKRFIVIGTYRS